MRNKFPKIFSIALVWMVLFSAGFSIRPAQAALDIQNYGLNIRFQDGGVEAQPQAGESNWGWNIRASGFGRGGDIKALSKAASTRGSDGSVENRFEGIVEWYRDTPLGLQQGFTVHEKPRGNGLLVIHIQLDTELVGSLSEDERSLSFDAGDGSLLHYSGLSAWDADGKELEARIVYTPNQIALQVNDRAAAYPITVDPIISLETKIINISPSSVTNFGQAVAMDGNTAVIGISNAQSVSSRGLVNIYIRSGNMWLLQQTLTGDTTQKDLFGSSLDIQGATLVVGAPGENSNQGAAYVFILSAGVWSKQARVQSGGANDQFGTSIALDTDTLVVGATGNSSNRGMTQVFVRSGNVWSIQQTLIPATSSTNSFAGTDVEINGNVMFIGAPQVSPSTGMVAVFTRSGSTWTEASPINGTVNGSAFGASIAFDGSRLAIAAESNIAGTVSTFTGFGGTWTLESSGTINPPFGTSTDRFGSDVAIYGNTVLISARGFSSSKGAAYIYTRIGSSWVFHENPFLASTSPTILASDGKTADRFGVAVAMDGDTMIIGADLVNGNQGAAYIYRPFRNDNDLEVQVAATKTLFNPTNDGADLIVSVTNYGPSSASFVEVDAPVHPSFVLIDAQPATLGSYNPITGIWTVGTLGIGVTATLTIHVSTTPFSQLDGQKIPFTAIVLGRDTNDVNNSASVTLRVFSQAAQNGGFNDYVGESKVPQFWTASNFAANDGKITTIKQEGTASVRMIGAAGKTKTLTQTLTISGAKSNNLEFSLFIRGSSIPTAGLCRAQALLFNGSTLVTTKTINCSTGTFAFAKHTLNFVAPNAYNKAVIKLTYAKSSGTVFFDLVGLLNAP